MIRIRSLGYFFFVWVTAKQTFLKGMGLGYIGTAKHLGKWKNGALFRAAGLGLGVLGHWQGAAISGTIGSPSTLLT